MKIINLILAIVCTSSTTAITPANAETGLKKKNEHYFLVSGAYQISCIFILYPENKQASICIRTHHYYYVC